MRSAASAPILKRDRTEGMSGGTTGHAISERPATAHSFGAVLTFQSLRPKSQRGPEPLRPAEARAQRHHVVHVALGLRQDTLAADRAEALVIGRGRHRGVPAG